MVTRMDETESLPREAILSDELVFRTTEPYTSQRRAGNGSVLIHRLPTEIFIYIINQVLADYCPNSNRWDVYTRTGELKLVCALWADRINSYPHFWNVLTNRLGLGHVSAVVRRSRAVPLHVDIVGPEWDIQTYITIIKSIAPRWSTLNICWINGDNAVLHNLLQVPAPQLQELSITSSNVTLPTTIRLFGGQAPLLHTVKITPNEWSIIRPIIPRLKHLVVDKNRLDASPTSYLELDMVIQALTTSPEIEVIKLSNLASAFWGPVGASTTPQNPTLLRRLRSITLHRIFRDVILGLLSAITPPRDCAINIWMYVTPNTGSLDSVLSTLYARFSHVVPLGIDIQITPWGALIVLNYEGNGAEEVEITFDCADSGLRHVKGCVEEVLHQVGEAIRASSVSVHLRIGRREVYGARDFPCEAYKSMVEAVDGLLPSTTKASIYGLYFPAFIHYAKSGFLNLSELIVDETRIVAPWEQLVELAKSRSTQAADPGSQVVALDAISLPSKGLDEAAREGLSRVVGQLNWTDDPHAYWPLGLPTEFGSF